MFLYTLTDSCDKNNVCMKKIGVDIFAVYPDISFGNIKSEKITEISCNNTITDITGITDLTWINYKKCSKWIHFLLSTKLGSFSVIYKYFITKYNDKPKEKL